MIDNIVSEWNNYTDNNDSISLNLLKKNMDDPFPWDDDLIKKILKELLKKYKRKN